MQGTVFTLARLNIHVEVSHFVKNTWKVLSLKMRATQSEVSSQCFLHKITRKLREDHAEADNNFFK